MLRISENIVIPDSELSEEFFQASGPGGQNVNKVATAVRLRFNLLQTNSLPESVRLRLRSKAGPRINANGELAIESQRYRTQRQNRDDAMLRLANLIRSVLIPPKKRVATKPTFGSVQRRLQAKQQRSAVKQTRHIKPDTE